VRGIGRELWEDIVAKFVSGETSHRGIGRSVGVSAATVKRAWETGWPAYGLPPVSEAVATRKATGRALAAAIPALADDGPRLEDVRRAALPSALYQVAEESRTLESLRAMGVKMAHTASILADGGDEVAHAIMAKLAEQIESGEVSPADAVRTLKTIADTGKVVADLIGELMKLHRLVLGQPGEIIGHKVVASVEEAVAILDRGTRQAARARELGLVALPGGRVDAGGDGDGGGEDE
jgi:hypothetical protein